MEVDPMNTSRIFTLLLAGALAASLGGCASHRGGYASDHRPYSTPGYSAACRTCGVVESVRPVRTTGTSSGTGAVLGGIVGGVIGSRVGDGDGRKAATVAGVVGGAVAGNAIEKNVTRTSYEVTARMDDGRRLTVVQGDIDANLRIGSRVRLHEGGFRLH
jgi:outer membrane lipoprotein SlyB